VIQFNNLNKDKPFILLKQKYDEALNKGQKNIEAISISSYNAKENEVDSRYVNLKFINNNEFIFFSNYSSPKANSFKSHSQISALIFWPSINMQIRIKAKIKKTSTQFNQEYFQNRAKEKNALAISSEQSKPIKSYDQVKNNFHISMDRANLKQCPDYWGGFSFVPYTIEFWVGHDNRLNKRDVYNKTADGWDHLILQP